MKWEQILLVVVILAVVMALVWRSSGKKNQPGCGCGCGCDSNHPPEAGPKKDQPGEPDQSKPTP
jgi:hypothetical protein